MADCTAPFSLAEEDRFDRLRRIEWWDQGRLSRARVLVIGLGALGNEILKHLALLGVGHVFIVDFDTVERSNLSRSVLFRDGDVGRTKVETAARAAREIHPDLRIGWFHGDAIYDLGLGVFRWADVVLAGLDSREARLHVNRGCSITRRPFVDAATEALRGVVRVFDPPDGPCYECTLSAADWTAIHERRGCAGMRAEGEPAGRTPTTSVTASIMAALQCQETVKRIHGMPSLSGEGIVFDGLLNDQYRVAYSRLEECNSHDAPAEVIPLDASVHTLTVRDVLRRGEHLGPDPQLELRHEVVASLSCSRCGTSERVMRPLGSLRESRAACGCGELRRADTFRILDAGSPHLDTAIADLGVPSFDIVLVRGGSATCGFEFSADASAVLGSATTLPDVASPV